MEQNKKLIEANINLGKGKNAVLTIFEGQTIEKQIDDFARKYRISN